MSKLQKIDFDKELKSYVTTQYRNVVYLLNLFSLRVPLRETFLPLAMGGVP